MDRMMHTDPGIRIGKESTVVHSPLFDSIPRLRHRFIGRSSSGEDVSSVLRSAPAFWNDERPVEVPIRQIHGGHVVTLKQEQSRDEWEADGVVTCLRNTLLTIRVADCMPVFLADREGKSIGLLHAGWRGVAAEIIGSGVRALHTIGTPPECLVAWVGPSIGPCCYEVGPEVTDQTGRFARHTPGSGDRRMLDLYGTARAILESEGVPAESIGPRPPCTCCNPSLFHSHRESGGEAGRNLAFLLTRSK